MALAAALARAATRFLLRGGEVLLFAPATAVPELSLRWRRQLCDSPTAEEPSAPGEDESWEDTEAEILRDVEPVVEHAKDILHSGRYGIGGFLSRDDEKFVVEKLLPHHPRSEDKIGCGLDAIMVGRHPVFEQSRCLFILRTNGDLEDFSYHKCLRAYIEGKYPSHADRFMQKYLVRKCWHLSRPQK